MVDSSAARYRYDLQHRLRHFPVDQLPPAGQVRAHFMLKSLTYAATRYFHSASRQGAQQADLERMVLEELTQRVAGDSARYLLDLAFDCATPGDDEIDSLPVKAQLPRRAAAIADLIERKTLWMPLDARLRCAPPRLDDDGWDECPY